MKAVYNFDSKIYLASRITQHRWLHNFSLVKALILCVMLLVMFFSVHAIYTCVTRVIVDGSSNAVII